MRCGRIAALAAAALLMSSCASTDKPSQPDGDRESPSPTTEAHGSLAECLQSHGVSDAGGPAAVLGPPAGVDQATWDEAMKACASLAPGPAGP